MKNPVGAAVLVRRFFRNERWPPGSAVYRLEPPLEIMHYGELTQAVYVVVAHAPASPINDEVVTVYPSDRHGKLFGDFDDDYRSAEVGPRLIGGSNNHKRVLAALQGGYSIR